MPVVLDFLLIQFLPVTVFYFLIPLLFGEREKYKSRKYYRTYLVLVLSMVGVHLLFNRG